MTVKQYKSLKVHSRCLLFTENIPLFQLLLILDVERLISKETNKNPINYSGDARWVPL